MAWTATLNLAAVWGHHVIGTTAVTSDGTPGSASGSFVSIDANTGLPIWESSVVPAEYADVATNVLITPPVVVGDEVWASSGFCVLIDGATACGNSWRRIDHWTGALIVERGLTRHSIVVPYGDLTYVHNASVFPPIAAASQVLDSATGAVAWSPTGSGSPREAVVGGGRLVVRDDTNVRSFPAGGCGATTCGAQWSTDLGATAVPEAAVDGRVLVAVGATPTGRRLVVLDAASGAVAWEAVLPPADALVDLAVSNGTVHVAHGSTMSAFDLDGCGAATCSPTWTATLGAPASAGPISGGGVVYVGRSDGTVQAFAAGGCGSAACEEIAHVAVDLPVTGLIVSGGRLFVEANDAATPDPAIVTAFVLAPEP
jgi:outer membrane protein assembly factor BamB